MILVRLSGFLTVYDEKEQELDKTHNWACSRSKPDPGKTTV